MNRAQLQAQLLNQGFQQAQAARGTDLQAQQGLGTYQSYTGGQQGFEQAKLDASQIAAREAEFAPFTQIRFSWTTTSTNTTRSLSYSNSRLCTTSSAS